MNCHRGHFSENPSELGHIIIIIDFSVLKNVDLSFSTIV